MRGAKQPVDPRAAHLIERLDLVPHPEGGYYRQAYRSASVVQPHDERSLRAALTTIYFLLPGDDVSRWHRVVSDEVWHFYEGAPLELFAADSSFARIERLMLGPVGPESSPVRVVEAHAWQAARSTGAFTLVGCTVAPGFEFADFALLRDDAIRAEQVRAQYPDLSDLI